MRTDFCFMVDEPLHVASDSWMTGAGCVLGVAQGVTLPPRSRRARVDVCACVRRVPSEKHIVCRLWLVQLCVLCTLHVNVTSLYIFCVATQPPLGDPLSASLRALVGEGGLGYN